jgi:hypothetical protein
MPYSNIRSLPLPYRKWFIQRLVNEFEKKKDAFKASQPRGQQTREVPMGEIGELSFSNISSGE